jgi:hypothetical protein
LQAEVLSICLKVWIHRSLSFYFIEAIGDPIAVACSRAMRNAVLRSLKKVSISLLVPSTLKYKLKKSLNHLDFRLPMG